MKNLSAAIWFVLALSLHSPNSWAETTETSHGRLSNLLEKRQTKSNAPIPVVFIHTNDIHGAMSATSATDTQKTTGGIASVAALLKNCKKQYQNCYWIDSGDWAQGTPEGTMPVDGARGASMVRLFNRAGITAAEVGNHEYDYGSENLRKLTKKAHFSVLGANVVDESTHQTVNYLEPYIIKKIRRGSTIISIGITGLLTKGLEKGTFEENIRGLDFKREIDAAQETIRDMQSRGVDLIVAATHMGYEPDKKRHGITEGDVFLAQHHPEIDLILGGHTHTALTEPALIDHADGSQTLITQNQDGLSTVYQITLYIDPETKEIVSREAHPVALDSEKYPADPRTERLVHRYEKRIDRVMGQVLGSTTVSLTRNLNGESLLGNWVTDVFRKYGQTDIAITNTKGLRADLPQGPITYGDIYKVMPFDNKMVKLSLSGNTLKKIIEESLQDQKITLQYSGLTLTYDPNAPLGSRLRSVEIGGFPLDENRTYSVTTMDYLAYVVESFKNASLRITDTPQDLVRDVLADHARQEFPISAALTGRIAVTTKN